MKKKSLCRDRFGLNKSPKCFKYKYIHTVRTNIQGDRVSLYSMTNYVHLLKYY